jgi:hypothetical protein
MRGTWVYRGGQLVEKGGPQDIRPLPPRSDLPCPMLIGDIMEPTEHVDGNFYTSKSGFRKVTKAHGLIEMGNDPARHRRPKRQDRDKAIEQSIDKAIARAS